jgi:bifunctional non-homologous end joining protein LigD
VRAIAHSEPGRLRFHSRNLHDITPRYPELSRLNRALSHHRAILDGEIVALDADGKPSFGALPAPHAPDAESAVRRLAKARRSRYMIFDLLWLDGHSLMACRTSERRARLAELGLDGDRWRTPGLRRRPGRAVLEASRAQGLEGVVAKRLDAPYEPGRRSPAWVKVKNVDRQEVVDRRLDAGEGRRRDRIGALLVGVREDGTCATPAASAPGSPRPSSTARAAAGAARARRRRRSTPGQADAAARRVVGRAALVAEVEFREWTQGGQLRAPSYKGLRDDKRPSSRREATPAARDPRGQGRRSRSSTAARSRSRTSTRSCIRRSASASAT